MLLILTHAYCLHCISKINNLSIFCLQSFGVDSSDDGSKSGFSIPKQTSKAASSKQTNKHKSDTKSPEKEEKLFFDPKRIFAPRPVKSQSTSNTEKKTEPLNNGKPKQNQTKCGIEKSNTSSFINNDLSYDWKQTNCDRHMADSTYKSEQTTKSNVTDPKLHRRTGDKKSMASKKFDRQKGGSDLYRKIRKTKDDNMKVVIGMFSIVVLFCTFSFYPSEHNFYCFYHLKS